MKWEPSWELEATRVRFSRCKRELAETFLNLPTYNLSQSIHKVTLLALPNLPLYLGTFCFSSSISLDSLHLNLVDHRLNSVDSSILVSRACRLVTSGPHASCLLQPINREAGKSL